MSKNVRISLYILIPIIIWMISGQFVDDSTPKIKERNGLTSVIIAESSTAFFAPKITLNASASGNYDVYYTVNSLCSNSCNIKVFDIH